MVRYDFKERLQTNKTLEDPYWDLDLSESPTMKQVLSLPANRQAIESVEKTTKGDKMIFTTKDNNFKEFYDSIEKDIMVYESEAVDDEEEKK